jgi:hypothetical protein
MKIRIKLIIERVTVSSRFMMSLEDSNTRLVPAIKGEMQHAFRNQKHFSVAIFNDRKDTVTKR